MKWKLSTHDHGPKSAVRVFRNLDIGFTMRCAGYGGTVYAKRLVRALVVLLPVLLVGSVMGGEPERTERVRSLVKSLADESLENRQATWIELRDKHLRKRDIPELSQEIARNSNPEVAKSLQELVTYLQGKRWRLPNKGWTADTDECIKSYTKEFKSLGVDVWMASCWDFRPKPIIELEIIEDGSIRAEKKMEIVNLILTLEPEGLGLRWGDWDDINFLATLSNLEEFAIEKTLVSNLTPLKGMSNLNTLTILNSEHVTDLSPLKDLAKLTRIDLRGTRVRDLTPLKNLSKLMRIDLRGTQVTDVAPLKGLPNLYIVTEEGKE